ncbi:MAG TPA: hypothetical protein VLL52_01505, partial [Anaerolineae bacterium]|nr:hypothetical protein [Anaerolineae bacterium]
MMRWLLWLLLIVGLMVGCGGDVEEGEVAPTATLRVAGENVFATLAASEGVATAVPSLKPTVTETDIVGVYEMEGRNFDGGVYRGELRVAVEGEGYRLTWEAGEASLTGVALLNEDNILAGSYGSNCGVV